MNFVVEMEFSVLVYQAHPAMTCSTVYSTADRHRIFRNENKCWNSIGHQRLNVKFVEK